MGNLTDRGLLAKTVGEYPVLAITDAGWRFLRNRDTLCLPRPALDSPEGPGAGAEASEYDRGLFQELREVRRLIAAEMGVPPYVVFGDRMLQQIAHYLPHGRESFLRISGVGGAKLDRFGERFLSVVRSYASRHGLAERPNTAMRPLSRSSRGTGPSLDVTKQLLSRGMSFEEIAEERRLPVTTIAGHVEALVDAGHELELDHLMPTPERAAEIRSAFETAGTLMLSPVKELLGDTYTYEEIRLVRLDMRRRHARPAGAGPGG